MSDPYIVQLDSILANKFPNMEFVKGDVGTNIINIALTKNNEPIPLTGKTVTVTIKKPDNTTVVYDVEIVDTNTVKFIPDANALSTIGTILVTVETWFEGCVSFGNLSDVSCQSGDVIHVANCQFDTKTGLGTFDISNSF